MIQRKTLDNGLRIILEEIPTVRSVTIGIWIKTGSRFETKEENGISHFIEHMLFKGTTKRNAQDIAEAFDAIGGEVNAFTSKEYTCLYAKVLDTHQSIAMDILADMVLDSLFDPVELEREKKVILEEIHMTNDIPDDIIHDYLSAISFRDHPLAQPILGNEENIEAITRDDLLHYMEKYYVPHNIVISIAGNANSDFLEEVSQHFMHLESKSTIPSLTLQQPIFHQGMYSEEKAIEQAHLAFGFEGLSSKDKDYYSMVMMNNLLGGGMSSRLFQEIREKQGMAYSIYSFHNSYEDSGLLTIYAGTSYAMIDKAEDQILSIIKEMSIDGVSDAELNRSKEQLKGLLLLGLEGTTSKMSRNASNEWLYGNVLSVNEELEYIEQVTREDLERMIARISEQEPAKAIILPEK
ncbi:putative Zn-dependent peptidase [Gracilibacillus halotolerans]|uniref:Putative Zn-dependent peptidase n=1 Tax=Gracilibacillus halotolerans TaxID=74386 RepID=A0A841RI00_9BACI|nr:putative Zn-dependent peptidase [Gracilibacillus halotolerans]